MNINEKIHNAFNSFLKKEEELIENIYIKTKTIDANKGASFNERTEALKQYQEYRLRQLTIFDEIKNK